MIPRLSIGPRTLLNDCNHSATAIFWRSAILDDNVYDKSHPPAQASMVCLRQLQLCVLVDADYLMGFALRRALQRQVVHRWGGGGAADDGKAEYAGERQGAPQVQMARPGGGEARGGAAPKPQLFVLRQPIHQGLRAGLRRRGKATGRHVLLVKYGMGKKQKKKSRRMRKEALPVY